MANRQNILEEMPLEKRSKKGKMIGLYKNGLSSVRIEMAFCGGVRWRRLNDEQPKHLP